MSRRQPQQRALVQRHIPRRYAGKTVCEHVITVPSAGRFVYRGITDADGMTMNTRSVMGVRFAGWHGLPARWLALDPPYRRRLVRLIR
jgi:hypothetical protein